MSDDVQKYSGYDVPMPSGRKIALTAAFCVAAVQLLLDFVSAYIGRPYAWGLALVLLALFIVRLWKR